MWFQKKTPKSAGSAAPIGERMNFAVAESYNLLRTNLEFSLPDKKTGRVIAITSSMAEEGKSYTSINLAYALAKNGERVLLIDADLRRPSLASTLGIEAECGLSSLLCGGAEEVYHRGVLHENLTVLPAGKIPPNPQELIGSQQMKTLLARLSAEYDTVILDCPPVNLVADPLTIGGCVDGYLLVVRHGFTGRREVREAVKCLHFAGARVLGFVYNAVSYRHDRRYSKNYYRRHSYAPTSVESMTEAKTPLINGKKG